MTDCPHLQIAPHVQNLRVTEVDGQPALHWIAIVTVKCAQCGRPFRFQGLPEGMSVAVPTVDSTGTEVRLPMAPLSPDVSVC